MKLAAAILAILALAAPADRAAANRDSQAASATGKPVTLVGRVVDAACYMIHPSAATAASHEDCGSACLVRGVPLAVENEADKTLYFPADGNKRLTALLDQRVRVTGVVTEKSEPMELKMPVGDKNQMVVRVDGGYKVVAIDTIAKAPANSAG